MISHLFEIQLNFIRTFILWPRYTLCKTKRKPAAFETQQAIVAGHLKRRNTTDSEIPSRAEVIQWTPKKERKECWVETS